MFRLQITFFVNYTTVEYKIIFKDMKTLADTVEKLANMLMLISCSVRILSLQECFVCS